MKKLTIILIILVMLFILTLYFNWFNVWDMIPSPENNPLKPIVQ